MQGSSPASTEVLSSASLLFVNRIKLWRLDALEGDSEGTVPPLFVYIMYFIHALPFTNSAINWILYGQFPLETQSVFCFYQFFRSTKRSTAAAMSTNAVYEEHSSIEAGGTKCHEVDADGENLESVRSDGTVSDLLQMNGSATALNPANEGQHSFTENSEMVDVRLLTVHEPTHL
ncbi:hypothetical protein TELCIR_01464 [Teladorsagia circumcincta]|uniref:Uncharacterized protein n=1 Tax=Teladorsagia circumcincta TaxID=45464 RepID=A0A2G9V1U1_TELCI|nr:hypothetical protein TELCIR_01464 [Teladorsagia circumcincta]